MKILIAIGTGSFIGAVSRYLLSQIIHTKLSMAFPWGTLIVNIVGCFLIGIIFGLSDRANLPQEWRLFLATGLIGGFTTYSAFSFETMSMLREGQLWYASAYVLASIVVGLIATFIGITIIECV